MKEHLVAIDIHVFLPIIFSLFCFQPLTRGIQTMSCLISFSDIFILTALSHALTGTSVFFFPKIYWCKLLSSCPVHRRYFGINGLIEYLSYSEPKHVNKWIKRKTFGTRWHMNREIFRHQWFKSNPQNISKTSVNNLYRHILPLRRVGTYMWLQ